MNSPNTSNVSQNSDLPKFSQVVIKGIVAILVMTLILGILKVNVLYLLGRAFLENESSVWLHYLVGGVAQLVIGILFAFCFVSISKIFSHLNRYVLGFLFGTILTVVFYWAIPVTTVIFHKDGKEALCEVMHSSTSDKDDKKGSGSLEKSNTSAYDISESTRKLELISMGDEKTLMSSKQLEKYRMSAKLAPSDPCPGFLDDQSYYALYTWLGFIAYGGILAFLFQKKNN